MRHWFDELSGLVKYNDVHRMRDRLPVCVRLNHVQAKRLKIRMMKNIGDVNPEINTWLVEQGSLCAVRETMAIQLVSDEDQERLLILAKANLTQALIEVKAIMERKEKDHSIPSNILLLFKNEYEWIAFRMRFL